MQKKVGRGFGNGYKKARKPGKNHPWKMNKTQADMIDRLLTIDQCIEDLTYDLYGGFAPKTPK